MDDFSKYKLSAFEIQGGRGLTGNAEGEECPWVPYEIKSPFSHFWVRCQYEGLVSIGLLDQ